MIRINLLPYRAARKKENVRNQILVFVLALVAVTAILGYFHFYLSGRITALDTEIKNTQKQVKKFNKIVKQVEETKKTLALVKKKLGAINTLDMNRGDAVHLLDTMTKVVVENRMWFTNFEAMEKVTTVTKTVTVTVEKKGKKTKKKKKVKEKKVEVIVKIKGIALDNKTVADFMTNLENASALNGEEMFGNVRLVTLQQTAFKQGKDKPTINLKAFEVSCQKLPLKADQSKDKEKK